MPVVSSKITLLRKVYRVHNSRHGVKDAADRPVVKQASSGRAKTGVAKKEGEGQEVVAPKSAAMMAREAIMRPEEKAARIAAFRSGSQGKAAESNEEKKG